MLLATIKEGCKQALQYTVTEIENHAQKSWANNHNYLFSSLLFFKVFKAKTKKNAS